MIEFSNIYEETINAVVGAVGRGDIETANKYAAEGKAKIESMIAELEAGELLHKLENLQGINGELRIMLAAVIKKQPRQQFVLKEQDLRGIHNPQINIARDTLDDTISIWSDGEVEH